MAGSSVELGGRGSACLGGSLGAGRRSRTPLTDLDAKFVTKSGLCVSGDVGEGRGGGGPRITHLTGSSAGVGVGVVEDEPRFPRLDQCAHFHYEYVELPPLQVTLVSEDLKPLSSVGGGSGGSVGAGAGSIGGGSIEDAENRTIPVKVCSLGRCWVMRRTYENFRFLDRQLHRCCYDRKVSRLPELPPEDNLHADGGDREAAVAGLLGEYVARLSEVAGSLITCGPVLNWLELDNRGHRLIVTDDSDINTPAVAAAYVVKRYIAQAQDEISFEVGDMISVIDMPPPEESIWWRGKRGFQVGFFPCECVQVIGDKVPQTIQPQTLTLPPARSTPPAAAPLSHHTLHPGTNAPTKPVLRKHGKLIAFFRSFILSRPSRRKLKQSGILRERVFGCDLGEHLLNSGHEIPMVLRCCSEFLERKGIVDGIYRLSGITSNIQKLRNAFDEDRIPDLYGDDSILQDIHCVSSVLKMYFRELPNPLLTYQLYEKFVAAVMQDEDIRLLYLRDVVQQLPPPHYRTLEFLVQHLSTVASHSNETGMTAKNIAIVWAPNLLRSKDLDMGGVAALQDVGTQAVVTEYLVRYVDLIFNDKIPTFSHSTNGVEGTPKKCRPKSLAISTPTKLISIEEARTRALTTAIKPDQKYIEVGGGPQNLPPKYHTVIELPSRKGGSLKQKKSPSGWKSIFTKGRSIHKHPRKASTPSDMPLNMSDSAVTEPDVPPSFTRRLRTVKSVESLISTSASLHSNRNSQALESPERREALEKEKQLQRSPEDERESRSSSFSSPLPSPRTHNRSVSHDSYFNMLEGRSNNVPSQVPVKEEGESDLDFSPENSRIYLDISELDLNFSTSEKDLKGFEVDTLKSTSNEEPDNMSNSTLDMENLSMCSEGTKSKENISPRPEKKSLKDKFRHKFTSPPTHRRNELGLSDSGEDSHNNSLKRASFTLRDKIVQALSPETSRRQTDTSPRPASPSSSPKFKHIRTGETQRSESHPAKPDLPLLLAGERRIPEHEGSIETVLAEIHVEPDSQDDTPSRLSMDGTLIDPELLDKITHLRASPSVSASEVSTNSLAEATVSDNESFTLGSSNSGMGIGDGKEVFSDTASSHAASNTTTPVAAPSFSVANENPAPQRDTPITPITPVTPMEEDITPLQEFPKPRPNSLLGLPTAELLSLGSALTSPETPQGDSTFLEIQYHPLSDTTEPSTPSESQFVQDLVTVGQAVQYQPAPDEPRQSSPLSIDLSSSDDPTEEGPTYENVEGNSLGLTTDPVAPPHAPPASPCTVSSLGDSQVDEQALMERSGGQNYDIPYENLSSVYENVQYGMEYENLEYGVPGCANVEFEANTDSLEEGQEGGKCDSVDEKQKLGLVSVNVVAETKHLEKESEELVTECVYENVESLPSESLPVYENLEESSDEQSQSVPEGDDAYEEYLFGNERQYENVEFGSHATEEEEAAEKPCDIKSPVEVEGEMVYQQVKFFRKSVKEVNDMLKAKSERQQKANEQCSVSGAGVSLYKVEKSDHFSELPVQVPQMGDAIVPQPTESLPCPQEPPQQTRGSAVDPELHTQPSEDSECLDSPITSSSVSMATEVLVLPSFASPTESTTDDVTSPVSSDDASSPRPVHEALDHLPPSSSPSKVTPVLPSLSPPTPENVPPPTPPAATSTPNRALPLPSIISPAPWPRTSPRHTPITAPVPRPRQLPRLNLTSPLVSPVSTPSSVSISPDSPATPGNSSSQTTPTEETGLDFQTSPPSSQSNFIVESPETDSPSPVDPKLIKGGDRPLVDPTVAGTSVNSSAKPAVTDVKKNLTGSKPAPLSQLPTFKRFKSSPEFKVTSKDSANDSIPTEKPGKENEEVTSIEVTNILTNQDLSDLQKRERIEQYKKERRSFLREKYKSESFRGEKDDLILRLRQKATSPSRPDEEGEDEDELIMYSGSVGEGQRRRESLSPSKLVFDMHSGKVSPTKQTVRPGSKERALDSTTPKDKRDDRDDVSAFKRTSPARRSLSDMGKGSELKSPTRTRFSSGGPVPTYRRNSSGGGMNSSPRQSPEKEKSIPRASSGETKSCPPRKNSSPASPVAMPDFAPPQRPGAAQGRRSKASSSDLEDDINVRARVATWGKTRDRPPLNSNSPSKEEPETKIEKATTKKQEQKGKETMIRKNSSPTLLSPVRKSSLPKATPSSPGIPRAPSLSPGSGKASSPCAPKPPPPQSPTKTSMRSPSKPREETSDAVSAAARGTTGQPSRIRDMAAIFERDSPTGSKPAMVRQSSREEKKDRY
ncbi:GTPase-activating protein CdGAPr-like isoform X3 [Eriocheir sinensis]|nr:GTPase-activating protein CdGAPr-like isoform X3 [Eriocheir sinensis]